MDFGPITRRPLRLFELTDQSWFPVSIHRKIHEMLTILWTHRMPYIQPVPVAEMAASLVSSVVDQLEEGHRCEMAVLDLCSGAGGPTPTIERLVNARRMASQAAGDSKTPPVQFVLSDLRPHVEAWRSLAGKSEHLDYIPRSVDAANVPADIISNQAGDGSVATRQIRILCLSFHHFDDRLARRVLRDTMEKADGFVILELQSRTVSTMILFALYYPTILVVTMLWAPFDWGLFFFTYVIPIIPLALVFDGVVSALRTRTFKEVMDLIEGRPQDDSSFTWLGKNEASCADWDFRAGSQMHTWPVGYMEWITGMRRPSALRPPTLDGDPSFRYPSV